MSSKAAEEEEEEEGCQDWDNYSHDVTRVF